MSTSTVGLTDAGHVDVVMPLVRGRKLTVSNARTDGRMRLIVEGGADRFFERTVTGDESVLSPPGMTILLELDSTDRTRPS